MGVYIPNMEKPKECIECEFSCLWANGSTHCMVDGEELFCDGIPQRHDCPLIEIPKGHGRLVEELYPGELQAKQPNEIFIMYRSADEDSYRFILEAEEE